MVCIIDDREDVWEYASNLIHVKPYRFFQHTGDIHAPPGLTKCENDSNKDGFDFSHINNGMKGRYYIDFIDLRLGCKKMTPKQLMSSFDSLVEFLKFLYG